MLFIINVLLHSTGFDLRSSLAGNMVLMTGVLSNIENLGLFFIFNTYKKSKK
jgi:hypothetical protein